MQSKYVGHLVNLQRMELTGPHPAPANLNQKVARAQDIVGPKEAPAGGAGPVRVGYLPFGGHIREGSLTQVVRSWLPRTSLARAYERGLIPLAV